jgi:uncharacterized membrane protein YbaN (DUF454 family)
MPINIFFQTHKKKTGHIKNDYTGSRGCDLVKVLLIFLGFLSLGLGGLGIILPGLPTTPFILLSAGLFLRSSETLYLRLVRHRVFGKYLRQYEREKGMSLRVKLLSILVMWTMISLSFYRISHLHFRITLLALGLIGTIVMGFIVRTVIPDPTDSASDRGDKEG